MSETSTILAPLDASNLQEQGLLRQGSTVGSRRLHKRRLNSSSDVEHHHIPLVPPPDSTDIDEAFVAIPEVLISRETLTHVGLSTTKGDELWSRWTNWPAYGPRREVDTDDGGLQVSFIDFIIGHIENEPDIVGESDAEWYACLDACGIAPDTQAAIMDPHFTSLRLSRSCLDWVRDTIEMRYAGLQDIQRASRAREMELQRAASRSGGSSGGEVDASQGGRDDSRSTASLPALTAPGQERRSISGLQQQSLAHISPDVWGPARAAAARNAPGHTVLYKGIDQARINGLFGEDGALSNINMLRSPAPSDFSGHSLLFYFTPDIKVAEYDAAYAKRRANCESVVIIVLCIPNAAIETLSEPDIRHLRWPSNDWKELVWRSRTQQPLPTRLRGYRDALLIIGSTSRKPNQAYHALRSWEDLTEEYLLKIGADGRQGSGYIATQFVINGREEGSEWLTENGGKDLRIFPYPQAELERFLGENPV